MTCRSVFPTGKTWRMVRLRGIVESVSILLCFPTTLVVYCPMGNGVFQVGTLSIDFIGMLSFKVQAIIPANLPTTSLWFLADVQLTMSLDLDVVSSYLDLVLLWRCGSQSKVQVLNIQDEGLREYLWIETTTKSAIDSQPLLPTLPKNFGDQADDSFDLRLFALKSCYAADIFKHAQGILRKYAINVNEDSKWEYLANLETVLRDLNAKRNETCSLTILRDAVILVNTLRLLTILSTNLTFLLQIFAIVCRIDHREMISRSSYQHWKSLHPHSPRRLKQRCPRALCI